MLASLLPGLRDVRTPLTVGYLWLFIGWAWFGDKFPRTRPPGHGLVARLFDLHAVVGTPATTAAVSFLAYLLGALLTIPVESRAVSTVLHRVGRLSPGARRAAATYDAYLATAYNQVEGQPTAVAFDEFASNFDVSEPDLRARLLVANETMYGEYDRLAAEASFRLNLCIPLLMLAVVTAVNFGLAWAFIPAVAGVLLLVQGGNRLAMSRAVIERAVISGVIEHSGAAAARLEQERYADRIRDGYWSGNDGGSDRGTAG
jgi:hypothetical protein